MLAWTPSCGSSSDIARIGSVILWWRIWVTVLVKHLLSLTRSMFREATAPSSSRLLYSAENRNTNSETAYRHPPDVIANDTFHNREVPSNPNLLILKRHLSYTYASTFTHERCLSWALAPKIIRMYVYMLAMVTCFPASLLLTPGVDFLFPLR